MRLYRPIAAVLLCLALLPARAGALEFLSLGSGEFGGTYFGVARQLCDRVNLIDRQRLRCSPEATPGSVYNVGALLSGDLDLAIVQSDIAHDATRGAGRFAARGALGGLRAIGALYVEVFTVLVRADSGIARFDDLRGKRVDHGLPGSGRRATMDALLAETDLTEDAFAAVLELPAASIVPALCGGLIDATVLIVGHPSALVADAKAQCDARLVPVTGPAASALVETSPGFVPAAIRRGTYPDQNRPIPSFGVTALLLAAPHLPDATVAAVTAAVIDSAPVLRARAPILGGLAPPFMASAETAVPLHPAAAALLGR